MVESKRETWHDIVKRTEDVGVDGLELNFGCPHGMSERGMGAAVGQVPEYACMITEWVKEVSRTPVIVKLTPNITDIRAVARAARRGGADALSAINTINSITGIDLDTLTPRPNVGGLSAHGGYCGPAVKPIALHLVQQIASDAINTINSITGIDLDTLTPRPNVGGLSAHGGYCGPAVKPIALHLVQQIASDPEVGLPISGIGGIAGWREAAEFMLLGCGTVQVCTAAMHYGFRIVEDMIDGLSNWMDQKGFRTVEDFRGLSLPKIAEWKHLDLNYRIVARIDRDKCIGCDLCYIACWDGAHQCIHLDGHALPASIEAASRARIAVTPIAKLDSAQAASGATAPVRIPRIDEEECVGCNLCWLVCPVENCITMEQVETGKARESWEMRAGKS